MSGSIAAYKVCHIISKLTQAGHEVQVVTSPHVKHFIGNSTLEGLSQKSVISDTFAPHCAMAHIHMMRWADIIVAAPATANFINKIAAGVGDDLLTTLFLAHDFKKPYLLAPAMNTSMYNHPITQQSLAKLKELSIEILETETGVLACGEVGSGRLIEPDAILKRIEKIISELPEKSGPFSTIPSDIKASVNNRESKKFTNKSVEQNPAVTLNTNSESKGNDRQMPHILITTGGTQEPIDSMRVLTNLSTGKTASRMADYFYNLGFRVTVLAAQTAIKPRFSEIQVYKYQSFADLAKKLKDLVSTYNYDAVIHAAAVSDFSVDKIIQDNHEILLSEDSKISSSNGLTITLKPNPKLLPQIKSWSKSKNTLVVGFKFTSTQNSNERIAAVEKLFNEGSVDFVVHNDSHDINRDKKQHLFTLFNKEKNGTLCKSPLIMYQTLAFNLFRKSAEGFSK